MSRTFRRLKTKQRKSTFQERATRQKPSNWRGMKQGDKNHHAFPDLLLIGKPFRQALARYRSDAGTRRYWYFEYHYEKAVRQQEKSYRQALGRELQRWRTTPEYDLALSPPRFIYEML